MKSFKISLIIGLLGFLPMVPAMVQATPLDALRTEYKNPTEAAQLIRSAGDQMAARGDRRSLFARVYANTIKASLSHLKAGDFKNPAYVNRLVTNYANIYRRTLRHELLGEREETALGWQVEFDYVDAGQGTHLKADSPKWNPEQDLILGIHVHITRDLLEAVWMSGTDFRSGDQAHDFFMISEILRDTLPEVYAIYNEYVDTPRAFPQVSQGIMSSWISDLRAEVWQIGARGQYATLEQKASALAEIDRRVADRSRFPGGLLPLLPRIGIFEVENDPRLAPPQMFAAGQLQPIASKTFKYSATDPNLVLDNTITKLKSVFKRYRPAFDSGTTIVKPLVISGTELNPRLQITAKKCVLFICETVDLDATISLKEGSGKCTRNFTMTADLSKSSEILVKNYRSLKVNICYEQNGGSAQLRIDAYAEQGAEWSSGTVTNEIFKMLSQQIPPMTTALTESLQVNGAR